MNVVLARTHLL